MIQFPFHPRCGNRFGGGAAPHNPRSKGDHR